MDLNIKKLGPNRYFLSIRRRRPEGGEDRIREIFDGSFAAAQERYIALRKELEERQALKSRFETLGDLFRFYKERRGGLSLREKSLAEGLLKALGDVSLPAFPARLEAWITHVKRHPSPKTGRPLENASINRLLNFVRAAFNQAVNSEHLKKNPITKVRFPKLKEVPRDRVLSPLEFQTLLNVIEKRAPHLAPIVQYALHVPCRKAELLNMRREDLDLFHNVIRVRNGTTKNDRGCYKPIPPNMLTYFRTIPADCPWLFYRREGTKYFPLGDFKGAWASCLRLAGISDFHFHDTRHISATALLNRGAPDRLVMQIANWTTDIMKVYYHRDPAVMGDVARFFDGVRTNVADTPESKGLEEAMG